MRKKLKLHLFMVVIFFLLIACHNNDSKKAENKLADTLSVNIVHDKPIPEKKLHETKRLSFKHVSEIVEDNSYSTWVELRGDTASLALHFQHAEYNETLAVSYSPECWLFYPYTLEGDKIVVFWDVNIDTKYNFDIVKAIHKTERKYIGKPFMILELVNDTTFKATYPLQNLIKEINSSSKERIFFPNKYVIAQEGYL